MTSSYNPPLTSAILMTPFAAPSASTPAPSSSSSYPPSSTTPLPSPPIPPPMPQAPLRTLTCFLRTLFLCPPQPGPDPLFAFPCKPKNLLFFPWTVVLANIPFGYPLYHTLSPFNPDSIFPLFISPKTDSSWVDGQGGGFQRGRGIREYLRRNGKLIIIFEVEDEEGRESGKMVELLVGQIVVKNRYVLI